MSETMRTQQTRNSEDLDASSSGPRENCRPREATGHDGAQSGENELTSKYWEKQFEVMRTLNSYWLNNRIIEEEVYRLITGASGHWLSWMFDSYFKDAHFKRLLSVCCGDGLCELQMFRTGKVDFLHGFDISEGALKKAAERFEEAGIPKGRFRFELCDANEMNIPGTFDLVVALGAVHHVTNLEDMLDKVAAQLDRKGYFAFIEYVGPTRMQYTEDQISIINGILNALDPLYLSGNTRAPFERPNIAEMIRTDPSEAVRSEDILHLVRERFDVEYERNYNGTLLAWLHPMLNTALANQGRADFDSIIRLISYFEQLLIEKRVVDSDFVFMVCRPKPGVPGRRP